MLCLLLIWVVVLATNGRCGKQLGVEITPILLELLLLNKDTKACYFRVVSVPFARLSAIMAKLPG